MLVIVVFIVDRANGKRTPSRVIGFSTDQDCALDFAKLAEDAFNLDLPLGFEAVAFVNDPQWFEQGVWSNWQ